MAAIPEKSGLMKSVDSEGNVYIFYPVVRDEDVAGLDTAIADGIADNLDAGIIPYNGRTVQTALEDLENISAQVFGVQWDTNPSTAMTRLTRATDPSGYVNVDILTEPVPAVGTGAGSSPFDAFLPWAGMEEYNIENGVVTAARGDAAFSRTAKDTMVWIPEFYCRAEASGSLRRFYISNLPKIGFIKMPGSGNYMGKYDAGDDGNGNYVSRSGLTPKTNITRSEARTGARAKGTGWDQHDYLTYCAYTWLYRVEFADWDCQKMIGPGNVSSGAVKNTGGTDAMTYHTGKAYDDENTDGWGYAQVQYRHVEDPWGNVNQWVDGVNFYNRLLYICMNPEDYADDTSTGYIDTGLSMVSGNSFISDIHHSEDYPWLFLPAAQQGDSSSYIPDYAYSNAGWRVLRVGGNYYYGEVAGLFYFSASYTSTNADANFGARLLFRP